MNSLSQPSVNRSLEVFPCTDGVNFWIWAKDPHQVDPDTQRPREFILWPRTRIADMQTEQKNEVAELLTKTRR